MSTQWNQIKPSDILSKDEMRSLARQSNAWGIWLILHCWAMVAAAMALYAFLPSIVTALVGIIIVGGRQLGMAVLMHEGSHGMLLRSNKLNDRLVQIFAASPVFIDLQAYRKRHMLHHRFTRTDKDPENFLYTPFPVSKTSMARKIIRDLTGIVFIRQHFGIFKYLWGDNAKGRINRVLSFYASPISFNLIMAAGFYAFGRIDLWLLLWLLPMATTHQLFLRIRNIAEHATVPDTNDPLKNSRTTLASIFERLTFAPYWVNYHIEHHLVPCVPCWHLPRLHKILLQQNYGQRMEIQKGYINVLRQNTL